jgi:transcriptional regulator with XRE-family HTH domain
MEEKKKSIGRRIKEAARSKNVSSQQLAAIIGKTRQAVYDIFNDRVSLSIETIIKISKELKIPLSDLLFDDPDRYYDLMPKAIPVDEVLKLATEIHKSAKEGLGLVNLRITKSREGIYILESIFRELNLKLEEEEINKFGNNVYESYLVTSIKLLKK